MFTHRAAEAFFKDPLDICKRFAGDLRLQPFQLDPVDEWHDLRTNRQVLGTPEQNRKKNTSVCEP
jgi:hypothetical protein